MKLDDMTVADLGSAEKIKVTKDETTIIGGKGDPKILELRVKGIKNQIDNSESDYDKEKLQKRLGHLNGGIGVIYVGGNSEPEMKEKKDRVEDAINATKCAIEEGIVEGGGMALMRIDEEMTKCDDEDIDFVNGWKCVNQILSEPFRAIIGNAGKNSPEIKVLMVKENDGYDVKRDKIVDMFESGIVDPVKVTRTALTNAVSVAGTFLTTEVAITIEKEEHDLRVEGMM